MTDVFWAVREAVLIMLHARLVEYYPDCSIGEDEDDTDDSIPAILVDNTTKIYVFEDAIDGYVIEINVFGRASSNIPIPISNPNWDEFTYLVKTRIIECQKLQCYEDNEFLDY